MLNTARAFGVNVPPFAEVSCDRDVEAFAKEFGYPVILKPRLESSAAGISKIEDISAIREAFSYAQRGHRDSLIAQVFVDAPIIHVDGVFSAGKIVFFKASDYVNTCLMFRGESSTLGSVEKTSSDSQLVAIEHFAEQTLNALSADGSTSVFHMEIFEQTDATGGYALLEVGARVGGAMIPFIWREVHGIDLMQVAWDVAVGNPEAHNNFLSQLENRTSSNEVAGWLLVQNPVQAPCKITFVKSMLNETEGPYAEFLPQVGSEIPRAETFFEHIAGRFRFRGASPEVVKKKIQNTARGFVISAQACLQ